MQETITFFYHTHICLRGCLTTLMQVELVFYCSAKIYLVLVKLCFVELKK